MKYKFIKQHDSTDCAAACLAMVCMHYKKETTILKLRDLMGTDLKGTNLIGMSKCANKLGFDNQSVRVDKQGFLSDFTLPAIANTITKDGLSHFVVVFKKDKKRVTVGDPAKGLIKVGLDEFYSQFTGVILILKPSVTFLEDKTNKEKMYIRFWRLIVPQKKLFLYSIVTSLILTILGIVSSIFNKILMDEILPFKLNNTLLLMVMVFSFIYLAQIILGFIRQWMMLYLSQRIDIPLLLGYFEKIYGLPMKFFSTRKTGDITTRFSDAFTIKNIFINIALTLIMDITMACITGIILFNMNLQLFGIIIFLTIINIILIFIFKEPYKQINEEQMQQSSILNSQIIEGLRAFETIKVNANEDYELENIEREYIKSLRISFKEGMISNVQNLILNLIQMIGRMMLTYVGIMQVINDETTIGYFMAFMTLSGYFIQPINNLVGLQLQIQEANISMKRIMEILDAESEKGKHELNSIQNAEGDIEFKNITFRYGNRSPVLNDVSFKLREGEKVALVGSSGSGKSTIVKLLLKYYEPESGSILINNVNIEDYNNKSIRKAISYVPQVIELFSKSISDNIKVSDVEASFDEIKVASKNADAHRFIMKLPMKYNTFLEEGGNGLSGGEKQRISLARAFLKKSKLYIFDEPTSNLDFVTEKIIFDTIYNKFKNKSMIIIAHRLSTVKNCDKIIVLENGKILESGTHIELLKKEGAYKMIWDIQQGNNIIDKPECTDKQYLISEDMQQNEMTYY